MADKVDVYLGPEPVPMSVTFCPFTGYFITNVGLTPRTNRKLTIEEVISLAAARGQFNV